MAQKPYKFNIEYIQKYYSHGSEAKVVELKPVYTEVKPQLPKKEKEPVTKIYIDPIAFCGLMVAVVMLVVMLTGLIQFHVISQDHAVMESYVTSLREENVLLKQSYAAHVDIGKIQNTAAALGMIPIEQAQSMSVTVVVPQRQPEPTLWDDILWFFSGLFE